MSPRVYPPRRAHVGFRLDELALAAVDAHAAAEEVDRSEMLRRLINDGLRAPERLELTVSTLVQTYYPDKP